MSKQTETTNISDDPSYDAGGCYIGKNKHITADDIERHWPRYALDYFAEVLNREVSVDKVREDILSHMGDL